MPARIACPDTDDLLARIERTYDALPRAAGARVERIGPFELFVREGSGWPFYARPRLGAAQFTVYDLEAVLHRQRQTNNPEAIEWVLDITPDLLDVVQSRMAVELAPLMVLDPAGLPDPELARHCHVARPGPTGLHRLAIGQRGRRGHRLLSHRYGRQLRRYGRQLHRYGWRLHRYGG